MFESGGVGAAALIAQVHALGQLLSGFDGRTPGVDTDGGGRTPGGGPGASPAGGSDAGAGLNAGADVDAGAELVGLLSALEELKCRAEGAQVMASVALDADQRAVQAGVGVPAARRGVGVGLQVALARRESHHRGRQYLGLAKILVAELPGTLGALRGGRISQWRAMLIARETACLSREHRTLIDQHLGAQAGLAGWGEGQLVARVRQWAYQLDPGAVLARRAHAQDRRGVWVRPAPDTMTYLTALLPVREGVGVFAALTRAAQTAAVSGDPRSRGQVMTDLLVTRILGQPDHSTPQIPVTVNLVVSDQVLLAGPDTEDHNPHDAKNGAGGGAKDGAGTKDGAGAGVLRGGGAFVSGYGPVPPSLARELAAAPARSPSGQVMVVLRRLYARPADGALVGMDARTRCFPTGLAQLIRLRDRTCRTPWCDAPIRHIDHTQPAATGGPTSLVNGQGLCEACNHAKQAPGLTQHVQATHPHQVVTTTPTGHTYTSTSPPGPRPADLNPADPSPARAGPARNDVASRLEATLEVDLQHWHAAA